MRLLATLLLFLSTHIFADVPTPLAGTYIFTQKYELTGCAEYGDTRGPVAHCKKFETKKFSVNDEIKVVEFFFDDKTNSFGAKYVHLGQFRSIPMNVLKPARTSSQN